MSERKIYWDETPTRRDWDFADKPLSREDFFKKYGFDLGGQVQRECSQFLNMPIGKGRDEFEQLTINNVNWLFDILTAFEKRAVESNVEYAKKQHVTNKKITALAVTSTVISGIALIVSVLGRFLN